MYLGGCDKLSGPVTERVHQFPVRWVVGNGIADPLDVIDELTTPSNAVVLGVDDSLDQVFGLSVDD
jgi:hypothetical protein